MTERLVVGRGRVGRSLLDALSRAGEPPTIWNRGEGPIPLAEVAILAVRDAGIAATAENVMAAYESAGRSPVLLHCAGGVGGTAPFAALPRRPKGVGLLHPIRSLSGRPGELGRGALFGVCGDAEGAAAAHEIVALLGGRAIALPDEPEAMARYHAACSLVGNHVLGLVAASVELFGQNQIARREAEAALGALLASVAQNLLEVGLPAALSGPIARGDVAVVERHLEVLQSNPALLQLYCTTGQRLIELTALPEEKRAQLRALLAVAS